MYAIFSIFLFKLHNCLNYIHKIYFISSYEISAKRALGFDLIKMQLRLKRDISSFILFNVIIRLEYFPEQSQVAQIKV